MLNLKKILVLGVCVAVDNELIHVRRLIHEWNRIILMTTSLKRLALCVVSPIFPNRVWEVSSGETIHQQVKAEFACCKRRLPISTILLAAAAALCAIERPSAAQIPGISAQTMTPIPGVGHDYLKILNDTVDPSSGSLSLNINIPVPTGRLLNLPFSINYHSNGSTYLVDADVPSIYADPFGGWSNSLPTMTATEVDLSGEYAGPTGNPVQGPCNVHFGYVFTDPAGERYGFPYLEDVEYVQGQNGCPGPDSNFPFVPTDTIDRYQAAFLYSQPAMSGGGNPYVMDKDGTTFYFTGLTEGPNWPSWIEDRNGNKLTVNIIPGPTFRSGFTLTDTIGRTLLNLSSWGNNGATLAVSGVSQPYSFDWETIRSSGYPKNVIQANTSSSCGGLSSSQAAAGDVIQTLHLPDGLSYSFSYDPSYGLLNQVTYPTGVVVGYTWSNNPTSASEDATLSAEGTAVGFCEALYDTPAVIKRTVSVPDKNGSLIEVEEEDYSYSTAWSSSVSPYVWISKATTVTTRDLVRNTSFVTNYGYSPQYFPPAEHQPSYQTNETPVEQQIQYKGTDGSLLRTVTKTWNSPYTMASETVQDAGGSAATTSYSFGALDAVTEKDEYDFGGSLNRIIATNYQNFVSPLNPGALAFISPSSVITCSGSTGVGNCTPSSTARAAETDFNYDETGLTSVSVPAAWHDNTVFGGSAVRANLTSEIKRCFSSGCPGDSKVSATYDITGQIVSITDACGNGSCPDMVGINHTTTFSYTDKYMSNAPSGATNAFVTSIKDALGHQNAYSWQYETGELASSTDANTQTTTYCYTTGGCSGSTEDPWNRPTEVDYPDGGQKKTNYSDSGPQPFATTAALMNSSTSIVASKIMDGLGRVVQTTLSDPEGTVRVDTAYDGVGEVYTTSNPYRTLSDSTYGLTTYSYDALGRVSLKADPDGSTSNWWYMGNSTLQSDESGTAVQQTFDALGRLTQVVESPSSFTIGPGVRRICSGCLNLTTNYQYDVSNNLLAVTQLGNSGTDIPRVRNFTYDSLSRLLCSSNPENSTAACPATTSATYTSGTTGYSYDPAGNLSAKTDARGVTIGYNYDVLNRVTSKTATGLSDSYTYDQASNGNFTSANPIGRLVAEQNNLGTSDLYSYDAMGRIAVQAAISPTVYAGISVLYDLAGNKTQITYPDGRAVKETYDGAGRTSAVDYLSWNGTSVNQPYLTVGATNGYDPAGHLISATFGNGVPFGAGYDSRERVSNLTYGPTSAPLWSKQYAWTANSNLQSYTDLITGVQRQFNYDSLNRLTAAQDIYSNLAVPSGSNGETGSTNSSGSGASSTPGESGALPQWTNPDDSNLLTDIGSSDSTWGNSNAVVAPNAVLAPDGTMTATSITAVSGSTDTYVEDQVAPASDYNLETMTGSVWLRCASGTQTVNLYIVEWWPSNNWGVAGSTQVQLTTTWKQFHVTGTLQNNLTAFNLQIGGGGSLTSGQSYFMWNPMLEDEGTAGSSVTNFAPNSQRFSTWNNEAGTASDNTVPAPDGTMSAAALISIGNNAVADTIANPAPMSGMQVTGSIWLKVPSGTAQVLLTFYEVGSAGVDLPGAQTVNLTTSWQRFQITGTTQSILDYLVFQVGGGSWPAGEEIDAWGAQVELASVAGPYVATTATPATKGTTLTNLTTYSQQINGPSWTPVAGTVNINSDTAPDGTNTAGTLNGANWGTNNQNTAYIVSTVPNPALYDGETVTASVYLRSPSGAPLTTQFYLGQVGNSGFDVSHYQTISLNTQWQRFTVTGTLQNGLTTLFLQFGSVPAGSTMEVWGAQLQVAPQAGPYIATTALPVTTGAQLSNILPNSQQLSGPNWAVINGSITGTSSAPDGTTTASVYTVSSSASEGFIDEFVPNPSLYDGETVTGSVYLRSNTSSNQSLHLYLVEVGDQGWQIADDMLLTLTPTWQRYDLTAALQNGLTQICLQEGAGGSVLTGQSFQLWGAQFVVGTDPGSYTPTGSPTTVWANGQAGTAVPNGLNESYGYDSFGNILENGSFNSTYTANNQMFGYGYDAAGNLLSNYGTAMTWDAESRLLSAGGATYIYDAEGNRVEKQGVGVTDTVYFGGQPLARYSAGQWTDLIYGPRGLLAEVPGTPDATPTYRVTDHLGTDVGGMLADGSFVNPLDYAPFGRTISGNTNDPYLFTGKERDQESGLDYFKYRMYASSMGRWMSPDPSGLTHADLGNPQSLNLYNYVGNSPLTRADLDGLCWKGFQWACNAVQSLDNGFHGLGFQTNASVDKEQHTANQLLHHDGVSTEGLSRRQVRKAYKLDMAFGSIRTGPYDDGTVLVTRVRPTAAQARAIWEKATGGKVPYDENLGRFYDMAHKTPIADGGSPTDPNNLEPMLHSDHMDQHMQNGDFARWGARGAGGDTPADVTVEPAAPMPSPLLVEPIDPIP